MTLKEGFQVSDEQLAEYVEQIREAAANAPMAERERPFYEEEELEPPRPGSGLGFVHIDRIPKQDVLPNRMKSGTTQQKQIRVYVNQMLGDLFYLVVPPDLPVLPPEPVKDRFREIWGTRNGYREADPDPPSVAGLIETLMNVPIAEQQLFFNRVRLCHPGQSLASYSISHGQTIHLFTRVDFVRKPLAKGSRKKAKQAGHMLRQWKAITAEDDPLHDNERSQERGRRTPRSSPTAMSTPSMSQS